MSSILCMLAGLSACGGADQTALQVGNTAPMPSADCEPQACQGMRIIDSNAETYRADSARRDALAGAVAKLNDAAPVH